MTPSKAATVFRELLQSPDAELGMFGRRAGLHSQPHPEDLMRARELLQSVAAALESGAGPDWQRVRSAWSGMRAQHAPAADRSAADATAAAALAAAQPGELAKPAWVRSSQPQKPSLGDLAPGAEPSGQPGKGKFIPVARPRYVPAPATGEAVRADGAAGPVPAPTAPAAAASPPATAQPPQAAFTAPRPQPPDPQGGQPGLPAAPEMLAPVSPAAAELSGLGGPYAAAPLPDVYASVPAADSPAAAPAPVQRPPTPPAQRAASHAAAAPPPPGRDQAVAGAPAPAGADPAAAAAAADAGSVYQSVAKYAAFCAACAEFPERLTETLASYGLRDPAERAALDEAWQDRFDDDPDVMSKWEQQFAQFRGTLRGRR